MGKEDGSVNTIVGKDATFDGLLEISGGLRVDGTVKGKISSADAVFIGPTGRVDADIEAKEAIVGGLVKGNIKAPDKVELQAKSQVEGDVVTYSLVVEQGALFQGNCQMKKDNKPGMPPPPNQKPVESKDTGFKSQDTLLTPQKTKA
jgi:cytoskeletal protein CcmA (bactofilin family)